MDEPTTPALRVVDGPDWDRKEWDHPDTIYNTIPIVLRNLIAARDELFNRVPPAQWVQVSRALVREVERWGGPTPRFEIV